MTAAWPALAEQEEELSESTIGELLLLISGLNKQLERIERGLERAELERITWQRDHGDDHRAETRQRKDDADVLTREHRAEVKEMNVRVTAQERWRAQWAAVLAVAMFAVTGGLWLVRAVLGE
jgi:hypothetical protein